MKILRVSGICTKSNVLNNNIAFRRDNSSELKSDTIQFENGNSSDNIANIYLDKLSNILKDKSLNSDDILTLQKEILTLSDIDKEQFIELYCKQTGFPDMQKTSKLIVDDITTAILDAAEKTGVEILLAGYNPTCSVGNGHALPGSDFDTFFVCLKNWDNFDNFKEQFKDNVNPLLCSVVRTRTNDVPDFVVIDDIEASVDMAQDIFIKKGLDKKADKYNNILNQQIEDWTKAGQYNLDVNQFVEDKNKTPLLRAGLLMEIYRDGNVIIDNLDDKTRQKLKNSCVYNYSNMQQMRSYKTAPLKNKHLNREAILAGFDDLSVDEKLEMIFNVVNLSIKSLKNSVLEKYRPMFQDAGCGNMEDLMQPLLTNKHRLPEYRDN